MATALLETGAGSGLSLGSSAAWRRATRRRQNSGVNSLVDADLIAEMIAARFVESRASPPGWTGETPVPPLTSEPSVPPVLPIGIAELCFQHRGFAARADDLHGNQHEQNGQQLRTFYD